MQKILLLSTIILISVNCATLRNSSLIYEELNYGICKTDIQKEYSFEGSPTGQRSDGINFKWISKTNRIKAEIGTKFAVSYKINSPKNKEVKMKIVWIFPKPMYSTSNNTTFNKQEVAVTVSTNKWRYEAYHLEKDFELIKGKWICEIYIGKRRVSIRDFYLY